MYGESRMKKVVYNVKSEDKEEGKKKGEKNPKRYTLETKPRRGEKECFLLFTLKFLLLRKSDVFFHSLELVLTPTL